MGSERERSEAGESELDTDLGNGADERPASTQRSRAPEPQRFQGMVGADPSMRRLFEEIALLAPGRESVLIHGESGTGKELVARALHDLSGLSGPLLPVNCSTLVGDAVTDELFGHCVGAFTGAVRKRAGIFEEAEGGTVFLDEIAELPLAAQPMLLRVLENGEVVRRGESRPVKVKVRVVAASHASLPERVRAGLFRADLYQRLSTFTLEIPPLRQRGGDVRLLAVLLTRGLPGGAHLEWTEPALALLEAHPFPANVRELLKVLKRAILRAGAGPVRPEHLVFDPVEPGPEQDSLEVVRLRGKTLAQVIREVIAKAIARAGANLSAAARELGVTRKVLYARGFGDPKP